MDRICPDNTHKPIINYSMNKVVENQAYITYFALQYDFTATVNDIVIKELVDRIALFYDLTYRNKSCFFLTIEPNFLVFEYDDNTLPKIIYRGNQNEYIVNCGKHEPKSYSKVLMRYPGDKQEYICYLMTWEDYYNIDDSIRGRAIYKYYGDWKDKKDYYKIQLHPHMYKCGADQKKRFLNKGENINDIDYCPCEDQFDEGPFPGFYHLY